MPVSLGGQAPASFDLKSAHLPLLALMLKSGDMALLRREFDERYADQPEFFDQDPLLIDLQGIQGEESPDLGELSQWLQARRLRPVAVHALRESHRMAANAAGLPLADAAQLPRQHPQPSRAPAEVANPIAGEPGPGVPPPTPVWPPGALVVDKPLRSGQQVYARGRDLIVMAPVNPGAEVISDGHIHVYAPLRGKAIAGARGFSAARIFALSMAPELVSIAGVYRTSEVPLPEELHGKAAHVRLVSHADGEKLVIESLNP